MKNPLTNPIPCFQQYRRLHSCLPFLLWILLLLWGVTKPSFALTEAQFIEKVLAQDKLLEESQIGLDIKQIELDASRDNYQNWKFNLTVDVRYQIDDADQVTKSDFTKKDNDFDREFGLEAEKRFLTHRGNLQLGIKRAKDKDWMRRKDYNKGVLLPDTSASVHTTTTAQYVEYRYPLLKPDANALYLKTHHRDIIDLQRQQLLFYETKEDFLTDRLEDYLSWVLYQRQDTIEQQLVDQLHRLQPTDVTEQALWKSTLAQSEQDHADTLAKLHGIQRKLAVLLDDDGILTETAEFDLHKRSPLITHDLSAYLQRHSRDLQRTALSMRLNEIQIKYYQSQKLPKLDFAAEVREESDVGSSRSTSNSRGASRRDFNKSEVSYEVGLEFSYPLGGNITNQANLDKSQLGVRKLEISYQEQLQDRLADLHRLNTLLALNQTRAAETVAATKQSAALEWQNYTAGQTSLRDVLQSYREQRTAQLSHLNDRIEYQMNRIEYDNLLDRIIVSPSGAH